jgi:hypothetical protein
MKQQHKLYQSPDANTITFHSMNTGWVMRITAEGRIEVADGADVTEAAQKVLDAMKSMVDVGLRKAVLAEREACARIAWNFESDENGPIETAIRARGEA